MSNVVNETATEIIFSKKLPHHGEGIIIHYEHEPISVNGWLTLDVRPTVAENEDDWLSQIEFWHRSISEQATNLTRWWWLYQGSRLILWETTTSFSLKSILFSLAVIEVCKKNQDKNIWIVAANSEVISYVSDWVEHNQNILTINTEQLESNRLRLSEVTRVIRFFRDTLKKTAFYLFITLISKKRNVNKTSVLVHSSVINENLLDTIGDHYFGNMLDDSVNQQDTTWLYNDLRINKVNVTSKLKSLGRNAYFNTDLFNISDFIFGVVEGVKSHYLLRHFSRKCNDLVVDNICFSQFSKTYIQNLVYSSIPIYELMIYRQFSRALKTTKAHALIYPYEEKPIERAMLMAINDLNLPVKSIAFAHAAYSKGHMYIKRGVNGEPPRPNFLAVNGVAPKDRFIKAGVAKEEIVISGSPRFHTQNSNEIFSSKNRNKILLICGLGFELRIMAAYLIKNKSVLSDYELSIRRCPHSWIKEQDDAESRMQDAGIQYQCTNGNLFEEIDSADIVIFESTSAGMEAVLRSKLTTRLNLSDIVTTQHFYGEYNHDEIKYCIGLDELKVELDKLTSLNSEDAEKKMRQQRAQIEYFYSNLSLHSLNNLLYKNQLNS